MSPTFDNIDSAHEYVGQLLEAIKESAAEVEALRQTADGSLRRREAFRLIAYKLEQLRAHVDASYHRLGELRTLQRMVEPERVVA